MPDITINNRRKKGQEKKNVTFTKSKKNIREIQIRVIDFGCFSNNQLLL